MGMGGQGATKQLGPISREIAAKVVMYTNCSQECEDTQDTLAIPQGTHSTTSVCRLDGLDHGPLGPRNEPPL